MRLSLAVPVFAALLAPTDACAFGPRATRAPLAAREVERGLVLPKGWTELAATYDAEAWRFAALFAPLPRVDLRAQLAWTDGGAPLDPELAARMALAFAEAPLRTAAVELGTRPAWRVDSPGAAWTGLGVRAAQGPFTLEAWGRGALDWAAAAEAQGDAALHLQVGPLALVGGGRYADDGAWRAGGGVVVQLSRGLDLAGGWATGEGSEGAIPAAEPLLRAPGAAFRASGRF